MLERVLVCLLAQGHLLIEGVPGLAKTLTIKTTAAVLGGSFARIQFTPDLVPADLVGTRVYRPDQGSFDTELGPVFCNFLLADEINRAPAKVQSALLEVMQERQVTIAQTSYPVPSPFLVLATQNPIESEGTYPLPGGADRPLHAEDPDRLPRARRGADRRAAAALRPARAARDAQPRRAARAAGGGVRRVRRSCARQLRGRARDAADTDEPSEVRLVRCEPARADQRDAGCARARAHARTRLRHCRRRARTRRRTRSGTGSCSATRRSPRSVTADAILDRVLAEVPAPEVELARPPAR